MKLLPKNKIAAFCRNCLGRMKSKLSNKRKAFKDVELGNVVVQTSCANPLQNLLVSPL